LINTQKHRNSGGPIDHHPKEDRSMQPYPL